MLSLSFKQIIYIGLLAAVWTSCRKIEAPELPKTQLDSILQVPVSKLNVPVFYPIRELEVLLNEKLNDKIIEAPIPINQKGDSLFLHIIKYKPVTIHYDGDHSLTYQLPLEVTGVVHGKWLGINVKNKTPIKTKLIVTLRSELSLNEQWNLVTKTSIVKVKWVEQPILKIAGLKFQLSSSVEKMLFKNEEKITQRLDKAVAGLIKIEKAIERLWVNLQKPIQINKKYKPIWLKAEPVSMRERIMGASKDTLTIEISLKTKLKTLLDTTDSHKSVIPLGKQEKSKQDDAGLKAYLLVTIPFQDINEMIKHVTDTMRFRFQGHEVRIKGSEIYGTDSGLAMRLDLAGDIKARLYLTGKLGYDSISRNLVLTNFGFDVNSEESLVNAADWFSHDDIIKRVQPHLSLSLGKSIEALPSLIFQGVEKGKIGKKIEIYFSNFDAVLHKHLISRNAIQVIIFATGRADVQLQKDLFAKKKKL
jgi:hypothetical protein